MSIEISLPDGRKMWAFERLAPAASRDWLVCLPGSGPELWELDEREKRSLKSGWGSPRAPHLLVLNKPGVDARGRIQSDVFERSFRRPIRVADYLYALKVQVPAEAHIFLLGFSEGAYLAPEIALRDRRVRALALLSGGTRSWLDEEVYKSGRPEQTLKKLAQVYARPQSRTPGWHGLSNATWNSYDSDASYECLSQLRLPIFTVHGEKDTLVDLSSVLSDLDRLRRLGSLITSRVYKNVGHTLDHKWLSTLETAAAFFRVCATEKTAKTDRPLTTRSSQRQTSWP